MGVIRSHVWRAVVVLLVVVGLPLAEQSVGTGRPSGRTKGGPACANARAKADCTPSDLAGPSSATATRYISSPGPLVSIGISADLNCSVRHIDDQAEQFYGTDACGTFVAVDGTVYGPGSIPAGGDANQVALTPVSQTNVTGTGRSDNPYKITTVATAGGSGIRLTQVDTYVSGSLTLQTSITVANTSGASKNVVVTHAGDCYLADSDWGDGAINTSARTASCVSLTDGRSLTFGATTGTAHVMEGHFSEVWAAVGTGQALPDTCACGSNHDNGAGVSWNRTLGAGASTTLAGTIAWSTTPVNPNGAAYVALGDSFSSGEGAPDFSTDSKSNGNACHRSTGAYPVLSSLASRFGLGSGWRACSGAKIENIYQSTPESADSGERPEAYKRDGTPLLGLQTKAITIGIGGNDANFVNTLILCIASTGCNFTGHFLSDLSEHGVKYRRLLRRLTTDAPNAQIYLVGYPRFFPRNWLTRQGQCLGNGWSALIGGTLVSGLGRFEQGWINGQIEKLDKIIHDAAADFPKVHYVDVYDAFEGNELCRLIATTPNHMNGISRPKEYSFHPNRAGQATFASRLNSVVGATGGTRLSAGAQVQLTGAVTSGSTAAVLRIRYADAASSLSDGSPVVTSAATPTVTLTTPSGAAVNLDAPPAGISVADVEGGLDVTIEDPQSGAWKAKFVGGTADSAVSFEAIPILPDTSSPVVSVDAPELTESTKSVTIDATADVSDDDTPQDDLSITWDPGDGTTTSTGTTFSHKFTTSGLHHVVVTATDPEGNVGLSTFDILITAPPFDTAAHLVAQLYKDLAGRTPTAAESTSAPDSIADGGTAGEEARLLVGSDARQVRWAPAVRLYLAYFLRLPDISGLKYWEARRDEGRTLATISDSFAKSSEFKRRYGTLTDADFVKLVYGNVLGRQPDSAGLAYWIKKMQTGYSRGRVMVGFSESSEYTRKQAGRVESVLLHAALLSRMPTAGEADAWAAAALNDSTADLASSLIGSRAYHSRFPVCICPTILPTVLPSGVVGTEYSLQLRTEDLPGPVTWQWSGSKPPGLSLASGTGLLSGTPTSAGTFQVTLTATGAGGAKATLTRSIVIEDCQPSLGAC